LLGYQFAPRLRDLGDQTLYRLDPDADFGAVGQLLMRLKLIANMNVQNDLA
jgi:TnpA family transposase